MIYVVAYLVIGLVAALYLPWQMARSAKKAAELDEHSMAHLTPEGRQMVLSLIETVKAPFSTWQIIVTGLLWPAQIIAWLWAEIWLSRRYLR